MKTTCLESDVCISQLAGASEPLAVLGARTACWLERSHQRFVQASDQNLGHFEVQAVQDVQELLRQATQRAAQAKADATPPLCPVCGHKLTRLCAEQTRTFDTRFGSITIQRTRGYCKACRKWRVPADDALGLEETAGYSPAVQEMAALLASKMPVEDASVVLEHLTGIKLPRATLDREARRQGERAQRLRTQLDQQAATQKPQLELTLEPYQMIIQLDAWNIRERDAWGRSAALRRAGQEPERWHWVYTGTCFRLDHRGQTAGGRPVISERGFVATRQGLDALREQMHAEALRRGLGQAAGALVIGDGAVWIWRIVAKFFPQAIQIVDWYHAVSYLVKVAHAAFGDGTESAKRWLDLWRPALYEGRLASVVGACRAVKSLAPKAVAEARHYFATNRTRLRYGKFQAMGLQIGSGSMESGCKQLGLARLTIAGACWSHPGARLLGKTRAAFLSRELTLPSLGSLQVA